MREWNWLPVTILTLAALWLLWQALSTPLVPAPLPSMSAPAATASLAAATYPPALVEMARAVSTALAPTPSPTAKPEPYAMSTVPPVIVCGEWVQYGTVCTMPKAPLPTPTPLATCPVAPQEDCIWRGVREGSDERTPQ